MECEYCGRKIDELKIVVCSDSGKIFCDSINSPLEEDSCARKYIEKNPDEMKRFYYFTRLIGNHFNFCIF
jgi:hypothetical protein